MVKPALPYVRLGGEGWPLPLGRAFFEHVELLRQAARDPGRVPEVLRFDRVQAMIAIRYLSPHAILRGRLNAGERIAGLGDVSGRYRARTAFRGCDLSMGATG